MIDCAHLLQSATVRSFDADACLQSEAMVRAAIVQAQATYVLGGLTLLTGLLALAGAGVVFLNGYKDRADRTKRERQIDSRSIIHIAAVYSAELRCLWRFLDEHDVIATLRSHAAMGKWVDFTPGTVWLSTYLHDPTTISALPPNNAAAIAYTYPRSINELGRLRWLHSWHPPDFNAQSVQQRMTADTLQKLRSEAVEIWESLDALIRLDGATASSANTRQETC